MKRIIHLTLVIILLFFVYMESVKGLELSSINILDVVPKIEFADRVNSCHDLLGQNLTNVVRAGIKIIQIIGAIIAIVNGMFMLVPAVMSKNADELVKVSKKLVIMAIILAIIFIIPAVLRLIGHLFNYDLSCFF